MLVPVGVDTAAQLYQTLRWLHGGFQFWDNYWYDGRYSLVDYSLLYYPLAGFIGQTAAVLGTLAASGYLFARLVAGRFGVSSAWPVRAFAVTAAIGVWISGEYPFALGMALGLLALSLHRHRRVPLAVLAALGALLASPLAFLLLLLCYVGIALGAGSSLRRLWRVDVIVGLGICAALGAALQVAFPVGGDFHFSFWALFQVLAMSAFAYVASIRLSRGGDHPRHLRGDERGRAERLLHRLAARWERHAAGRLRRCAARLDPARAPAAGAPHQPRGGGDRRRDRLLRAARAEPRQRVARARRSRRASDVLEGRDRVPARPREPELQGRGGGQRGPLGRLLPARRRDPDRARLVSPGRLPGQRRALPPGPHAGGVHGVAEAQRRPLRRPDARRTRLQRDRARDACSPPGAPACGPSTTTPP